MATRSVPTRGAPRTRRSSTKGTVGSRKGGKSEMGRGRAGDEGRPVEPGKARASGSDPDAVEVHRAGGDHDDERPRARGLGPDIPASGPGVAERRRHSRAAHHQGRDAPRRQRRGGRQGGRTQGRRRCTAAAPATPSCPPRSPSWWAPSSWSSAGPPWRSAPS